MNSRLWCLSCGALCEGQLYCFGSCAYEIYDALRCRLQRPTHAAKGLAQLLCALLEGGEHAVLALLGTSDIRLIQWLNECLDHLMEITGKANVLALVREAAK